MGEAAGRHFVFLQGPHGPFARRLAAALAERGATVRRVAFNRSDEAEWRSAGPLVAFPGSADAFRGWLPEYLSWNRITDLVLYGDSRPVHAVALGAAAGLGIRCHCFEEGYIRPHWITYERGGTNGDSPANGIPIAVMARALDGTPAAPDTADDGWGANRAHIWHSARYYGRLVLPSHRYERYRSARGIGLGREFANYARRAISLPARRLMQGLAARRLLASGARFHLALLQLSFDSAFRAHSGFGSMAEFVLRCIAAFAEGAPVGDILVFKSHPFEDGRERLGAVIAQSSARLGLAGRVQFLDGAPGLAGLLDRARSVVTANSTAAQQALWRGLPVAALGRAVYARPELVRAQPLAEFFADPQPPDCGAYRIFRRFLLATSQIEGSFYEPRGIAALCRTLPEAMLAEDDPYCRLLRTTELGPRPDAAALPAEQPMRRRLAV